MNGNSEAKAMTAANWIALLVAFAVYTGGAWALITSQINSRVEPLVDKVNSLQKLDEKYSMLLAQVAADHAERIAKETEIETQFNADSQLRNIQYSDDKRLEAIMWNHIKGLGTFPSAPFYQPNISQQSR